MAHSQVPQHIALIMDGNGRWAKKRMLPRVMGHKSAVSNLKALIKHCDHRGIKILTVYAFSTENWLRPDEEVGFLMRLFLDSLKAELKEMHEAKISVRFVGDTAAFNAELRKMMADAEALTAKNDGLIFNIAVNYGGRAEILAATQAMCAEAVAQNKTPKQISEAAFAQHLYTRGEPDPDLLIRTSGECRISNFLLWQCAYSELYFTPTLFPDFTPTELDKAIDWFQNRERRYGKISEQL
jgi:undecaprenyl diphosphate synthase